MTFKEYTETLTITVTFKEYMENISIKKDNKFFKIKELNIEEHDLTDLYGSVAPLRGIELFTELEILRLTDNKITDIEPLKNLKKLKFLNIHNNKITDLTPLKNLTDLKNLYIGLNSITDIEPIKHLDLHSLGLSGNKITNIEPIYNMKKLLRLNIVNNLLIGCYEKYNSIGDIILSGWLEYSELKELLKILKNERRKKLINFLDK